MNPSDLSIPEAYHRWYYDNRIWEQVSWLGVPSLKSVSDMWNYQEIITELRPELIIEFGTRFGGSALFFQMVADRVRPGCHVFTVDADHTDLHPDVASHPGIETRLGRSIDPDVVERLTELREACAGPVFAILDSNHEKGNVLAEMEVLRPLLRSGDYLVVEDTNINGHPVLPDWGKGPWEAVEVYTERYPEDYERDMEREQHFGFTFAPRGFLRRR